MENKTIEQLEKEYSKILEEWTNARNAFNKADSELLIAKNAWRQALALHEYVKGS